MHNFVFISTSKHYCHLSQFHCSCPSVASSLYTGLRVVQITDRPIQTKNRKQILLKVRWRVTRSCQSGYGIKVSFLDLLPTWFDHYHVTMRSTEITLTKSSAADNRSLGSFWMLCRQNRVWSCQISIKISHTLWSTQQISY